MTDTTASLLASLTGNKASTSTSSASLSSSLSSSFNSSFSQVLSSSLMSSGMGSLGSSSGLSGDSSSSATSLMLPLMLMLLEQITQLTAEQEAAAAQGEEIAAAAGEEAAAQSATQQVNHSSKTASQTVSQGDGDNAEPVGRPVGGTLTQAFGASHNGLDFGIVTGTPVKSTQAGEVIYSGWNNEGYGNLVIVQNGAYRTYYAHLSSLPLQTGDTVNAGDVVGYSGSTGNSTGPHLHYEIRINGVAVDPTSRTLNSGVSW